jgi:HD-like signal output (HDOD) protein/CheY-like chemotaxis protein
MKSLLFVDDEPLVLQGLQRMLHSMRHEWDMRFARGGGEALRMLAERPAEVVISDMRMPDMNGAELLNTVMKLYPRTVRFILSGFADTEMIKQCIAGTHQFLTKPCDKETLTAAVRRVVAMDTWLNDDNLKAVVSHLNKLPSIPALYFQILKDIESPDCSLERIGNTIAQDPAMTAKILQLVNSAFFGLRRRISAPSEAVLQLGQETIKSLVLAIHVFSEFSTSVASKFQVEALWRHSLFVGKYAKKIARMEHQESHVIEEFFTAGLLHDVGRLVLMANFPDRYSLVMDMAAKEDVPLMEIERSVFGACHAQVGGYLLGLWGLPVSIVEAATFHHEPLKCEGRRFSPLAAVHVANVMEQKNKPNSQGNKSQLNVAFLSEIGVASKIATWESALNSKPGMVAQ